MREEEGGCEERGRGSPSLRLPPACTRTHHLNAKPRSLDPTSRSSTPVRHCQQHAGKGPRGGHRRIHLRPSGRGCASEAEGPPLPVQQLASASSGGGFSPGGEGGSGSRVVEVEVWGERWWRARLAVRHAGGVEWGAAWAPALGTVRLIGLGPDLRAESLNHTHPAGRHAEAAVASTHERTLLPPGPPPRCLTCSKGPPT